MTTTASLDPAAARDFRGSLAGRVILPGEDDYDAARALFVGDVDLRPAVIVRATGASDVVTVVRLARESGLELAVRGGGHSGAGHGSTDGGILLDLAAMKGLDIDPGARLAWAGAGLTAGEMTTAPRRPRPRRRIWRHRLGRDRRDHPRGRHRVPGP